MRMKASTIALGVLVFVAGPASWAADRESEIAAIKKRAEQYVAAYNRQDAKVVADLWSEDAVYVNRDTGERIQGRTAIAAMFGDLFQNGEPIQLTVIIDSIRLVTSDVAIEDGTAELSSSGQTLKSTYTAVHVKKAGQWYLDSVRETDTPPPPPAASSQLEPLAWLVGEWLDQDENSAIRTRWVWTKNKRFLTSTFRVSIGDRIELEGTQVIGWDPVAGRIRSWVFDSEGGFGEGTWEHVGNQWIVRSVSTLSDGSQGSAVNVYTYLDENTFTWKSVDRQMNGEPQPDIEAVNVYRQGADSE